MQIEHEKFFIQPIYRVDVKSRRRHATKKNYM